MAEKHPYCHESAQHEGRHRKFTDRFMSGDQLPFINRLSHRLKTPVRPCQDEEASDNHPKSHVLCILEFEIHTKSVECNSERHQ